MNASGHSSGPVGHNVRFRLLERRGRAMCDLRAVQKFFGYADPPMTSCCAHVVDMAKKNPVLFMPVKAG